MPGPPYHPGPLWPGDPTRLFRSAVASAQISVLLHHPLRVALLPITTGGRDLSALRLQFMGVLGHLSIRLPHLLYTLWTTAILSAVARLATEAPTRPLGWFTPVAGLVAILGSAELIFLSLYVTWTPVGMARIDGMQGRYFIPLLPMLLFVLPGGIGGQRVPVWIWWLAPLAAILAMDVTIPRLIEAQFYG